MRSAVCETMPKAFAKRRGVLDVPASIASDLNTLLGAALLRVDAILFFIEDTLATKEALQLLTSYILDHFPQSNSYEYGNRCVKKTRPFEEVPFRSRDRLDWREHFNPVVRVRLVFSRPKVVE